MHYLQDIWKKGDILITTEFHKHWHLDKLIEYVEHPIQNLLYLIDTPTHICETNQSIRTNQVPTLSTQ